MTDTVTDSYSPGAVLAGARQKQGKSLSDISRATCILECHLNALEQDDYDSAGTSATFVIGYVRSYSRVLDVDEKPLVEHVEKHFEQQKTLRQPVVQVKSKPFFMRLPFIAGLAALLLFLGLGQWFFNQEQGAVPVLNTAAPDVSTEPTAAPAKLDQRGPHLVHKDLVHQNLVHQEQVQVAEPPKTIPTSALPSSNALPPREAIRRIAPSVALQAAGNIRRNSAGRSGVNNEGDNEGDNVVPATRHMAISESKKTLPASDVDGITEQVSTQVAGSDKLSLRFSDDCWLQIYDADRRRLLSRLAKKGESLNLEGRAPFDVKLGNAAAAIIVVNDRQIDFEPPQGRRVLRMQVGP